MFETIHEHSVTLSVPSEKKLTKKMPVFYNPVMEFNRTCSILLLKNIKNVKIRVADPLAGTGIRGIRFLKELPKSKIEKIYFNDANENAVKLIKKNATSNNVAKTRYRVSNKDANEFILDEKGFDYIDVDPFGTPNPFLQSAILRGSRGSILAVTATDTAALCGTARKACIRKYYAEPLRNELMHEIGLRILIRKVQLVGAQFDRALVPVFSYFKDHYMRIFFVNEKGKEKVDKILKEHNYFFYNSKTMDRVVGKCQTKDWLCAGPIWTGKLFDVKLATKIAKDAPQEHKRFLETCAQEAKVNEVGFYDIHKITKKTKAKKVPTTDSVISQLKKKGYKAAPTHFVAAGIRTNAPHKEILKAIPFR